MNGFAAVVDANEHCKFLDELLSTCDKNAIITFLKRLQRFIDVKILNEASDLYFEELTLHRINKNGPLDLNDLKSLVHELNMEFEVCGCLLSDRKRDFLGLLQDNGYMIKDVNEATKSLYYMASKLILETKLDSNLIPCYLTRQEINEIITEVNESDITFKKSVPLAYYKDKRRLKHVLTIQRFWRFHRETLKKHRLEKSATMVQKTWRRYFARESYKALREDGVAPSVRQMQHFQAALLHLLPDYECEMELLELRRQCHNADLKYRDLCATTQKIDADIGRALQTKFSAKHGSASSSTETNSDFIELNDEEEHFYFCKLLINMKQLCVHLVPFVAGNSLSEALASTADHEELRYRRRMRTVRHRHHGINYKNLHRCKVTLLEMLRQYEKHDKLFANNNYIFALVAHDLTHKTQLSQQRSLNKRKLTIKLHETTKSTSEMQEKLFFYEKYRETCTKKALPGKKFTGKSRKYSGEELLRRGILESIEGLPEIYLGKVMFTIKREENGWFRIEGDFMDVKVESAQVALETMVALATTGVATYEIFRKVNLNVAQFVSLAKSKFLA